MGFGYSRFDYGRRCRVVLWMMAWSVLCEAGWVRPVLAQESVSRAAPAPPAMSAPQMEKRLQEMSDLLLETRRQLEQSHEQMNALTAEIEAMRKQMAAVAAPGEASSAS